ncbi:hypothetical protein ACH5RR_007821 [Cinchona calisaya]|uniref:B box-type domain-containing protein n=1 Tax=Cinchona calisaya TaxID=153742 RepID=A0ABD3ABC2_9GENT
MKIFAPPPPPPPPQQRSCELCSEEAAVYCASDIASLCRNCDVKVHDANFLVARHLRNVICSVCKGFTGILLSGKAPPPPPPLVALPVCDSCRSPSASSSSSSSSSTPSSVAAATRKKMGFRRSISGSRTVNWCRGSHVDIQAEGIFVNWCRRIGGVHREQEEAVLVKTAIEALRRTTAAADWPFRVCLAASLWFGFRVSCRDRRSFSACHVIKRLEEISGVPAKLISAAESKLESLFKLSNSTTKQRSSQAQLEEGWAECSN